MRRTRRAKGIADADIADAVQRPTSTVYCNGNKNRGEYLSAYVEILEQDFRQGWTLPDVEFSIVLLHSVNVLDVRREALDVSGER